MKSKIITLQKLLVCITVALFQQMTAQTYELHNSINFNSTNDGRDLPDGITWFQPTPLSYGIYRTSGSWLGPNYQQLKIAFETGIIIDGGFLYGKSGTFIQPNGGNVGIGTTNPSNIQGWGKVLDVAGPHHSKILATAEDALYKVGIFSHNQEWYGGGGFVGTESNHTLHLITNYNVKMSILTNGNVGIGTTNPTSKLTVAGNINSREVKVTVDAGADFVFENNYNLPSLDAVDQYIKENKHLPEIASADEMKKEGINLSEMNIKLLQKIEELTLYTIEQQRNTEKLTKVIETLTKRLEIVERK